MKNLIYLILTLLMTSCLSNVKTSFELKEELINKGFTPISIEKETTEHLILYAKINGLKRRFILDTGATNSIIDKNQKENLNINSSSSEIAVTGAGKSNIPMEMAKDIKLEISNVLFDKKEFIIMNLDHINNAIRNYGGKPIDGIIGSDILSESSAIIDYSELNIYIKQSTK